MPAPQVALGGDASHQHVGQIGFGLMGLTWKDSSAFQDEETMFGVMKAAVDGGATLWNTGTFYCPPDRPYANLHLIQRFFAAHPDYLARVVLCVKGGAVMETYAQKGMAGLAPDMSLANLEHDVRAIRKALGSDDGGHDIDLYEVARVDLRYSPEQWMGHLLQLKSQGLFRHISLSEVGASTIRKAAAVGPVCAVEVEYSPVELSIETNGVLAACKELRIPILAYSPVAKGLLAGSVKTATDFPKGDPRSHQERLSGDNLTHNAKAGDVIADLAQRKGCTAAQLVLAWLCHQWPEGIIPIPGTTNAGRAGENSSALSAVAISASDDDDIRAAIKQVGFKGERYAAASRAHGNLFAEQ